MIENKSGVLLWSSLVVMIHLFEIVPDFENFMGLELKSNNENLTTSMIFSAVVGVILLYNGFRFASSLYVNYRRTAVEAENINSLWECAREAMDIGYLKHASPTALFSVLEKVFEKPEIIIDNSYSAIILPRTGRGEDKLWKRIDSRNRKAKKVNRARSIQFWCLDFFPPTLMFFWASWYIFPECYGTWKMVLVR